VNKGKEKCCYEEEMAYEPVEMPEEMECKPHPKPRGEKEVILNCGTVTGSGPLSCYMNGGGYGPQSTVQASVVLDTEGLKKVSVKIDFSALISFRTSYDDYFLHLGFKLSKICGGACIPLGTWTFEKIHGPNIMLGDAVSQGAPQQPQPPYCDVFQETDPFSFSWCECDDCPGCCRYIVELVDQQCYNIASAVITNISMTALAVGEKRH
jgi:hypothetical protein